MPRSALIVATCLGLGATAWPGRAPATPPTGPPPAAQPGPAPKRFQGLRQAVWQGGAAFHRFSLRHGMLLGTGLVVGGVAAGNVLYAMDMDSAAAFVALAPPHLGVKMNTVVLSGRLVHSYRKAAGTRLARLATMAREETQATALKLWVLGVHILGTGQVVEHGGAGIGWLEHAGSATVWTGVALTVIGLGLHAVPRSRQALQRWRAARSSGDHALPSRHDDPPR